jgi:hypothetical protein
MLSLTARPGVRELLSQIGYDPKMQIYKPESGFSGITF